MRKQGCNAFTLIELLVVVAIIAILSGLAITMYGNTESETAETISIANQKRITSAATTYQSLKKGALPNYCDSLFRNDAVNSTTGVASIGTLDTPLYTSGNALLTDYQLVFFSGLDANDDGITDTGANSLGLAKETYGGSDPANRNLFRSLTAATLTQDDVDQLAAVGMTHVYDISPADSFHGDVSYTKRPLAAGGIVALVDPTTSRNGQSIYKDMGVDLTSVLSHSTGNETISGDLTAAQRNYVMGNTTYGKRFFVFGLGPNCTLVGDPVCGLQEAPECKIVKDGQYKRYLLVVSMRNASPNDYSKPVIRMVLDSFGKSSRGAAGWASRTN